MKKPFLAPTVEVLLDDATCCAMAHLLSSHDTSMFLHHAILRLRN